MSSIIKYKIKMQAQKIVSQCKTLIKNVEHFF